MKYYFTLIVALIALVSGCERPPTAKETPIDHNTMDHSKMNHSKMESSPDAIRSPYELQFLDTMILHHQGAIDMAQLAETRAQHNELKTLAKTIIADQQKEIAQMKKWRDEWFAGRPQAVNMDFPGMRDGMKGMDMAKLDALKANDFDLEFIKQMIPHHEGGVLMAKDVVAKFPTDPAKQTPFAEAFHSFAASIVKAQEAEIKQMNDWRPAWSK